MEVTSRLRGGGKHKDKKGQKERMREVKQEGPEQKLKEELKRNKGPLIQECDRDTVVQMIEESEENRKVMVRMLEENEDNRKMIESICDGSDVEVEQALQNYRTAGREVLGWDQGQVDLMERGLKWAVEARRKERRAESKDETEITEGQEQHEEALSREKERSDAMRTDEQNAMSGPEEAKTGGGRAGIVPGGDESRKFNETSRKGKGKGNGGKGDHEGKGGGFGRKGFQQSVREKEEEWGRVAPNMGQVAHTPRPLRIPERKRRRRKRHERRAGQTAMTKRRRKTRKR